MKVCVLCVIITTVQSYTGNHRKFDRYECTAQVTMPTAIIFFGIALYYSELYHTKYANSDAAHVTCSTDAGFYMTCSTATNSCVTCSSKMQPFISCVQLQGFPIDSHTFTQVR